MGSQVVTGHVTSAVKVWQYRGNLMGKRRFHPFIKLLGDVFGFRELGEEWDQWWVWVRTSSQGVGLPSRRLTGMCQRGWWLFWMMCLFSGWGGPHERPWNIGEGCPWKRGSGMVRRKRCRILNGRCQILLMSKEIVYSSRLHVEVILFVNVFQNYNHVWLQVSTRTTTGLSLIILFQKLAFFSTFYLNECIVYQKFGERHLTHNWRLTLWAV